MNRHMRWCFPQCPLWVLTVSLLCLGTLVPPAWGVAQLIDGDRTHAGATNAGVSTGTGAAYVLTLDAAIPAYVAHSCYLFEAHVANTGPATINVNGQGALAIVKFVGGVATALIAGDIGAGQLVEVCYDGPDGTPRMQTVSLGGGVQPRAATGSEFVTGLTAAGTLTARQPVATDLSDYSSLVTLTSPGIFENKKLKPGEALLTLDGSNNVAVNVNAGHIFISDNLAANPTFLAPTGSAGQPFCSQEISFRLKSAAPRAITWNAAYRGRPALPLPTTTTGDGTTEDDFKFRLNCTDSKWVFMSSSTPTGGVIPTGGTGYKDLPLTGVKLHATQPTSPSVAGASTTIWFDDTSPECVLWETTIPGDYTGSPVLRLRYVKATSTTTTHTVTFDVSIWDLKTGASVQSANFDTANNCDDTTSPNAVNVWDEIVCALTNVDTMTAGASVQFQVCSDVTTGTWTGDLGLNRVRFEYAR